MTEGSGVSYIEEVLPDIKKAAEVVAKKWLQVTTEEDLFQDLILHFLESPGSLEKLSELEKDKRQAWIIRIGHQRASKARDEFSAFSGQFNYSSNEVRKLLESGVLTHRRNAKFTASVTDLLTAMDLLKVKSAQYHQALVERYVDKVKHPKGSPHYQRLYRAVDALTTRMNRLQRSETYDYLNGGRRRDGVTNSAAVGIMEANYQGESDDETFVYLSDTDTDRYDREELQ